MNVARGEQHEVVPFSKRKGSAALDIAEAKSPLLGAAQMLEFVVPALIEAERAVARLQEMTRREGRRLANQRGVAFIREEQIRAEFGGGL